MRIEFFHPTVIFFFPVPLGHPYAILAICSAPWGALLPSCTKEMVHFWHLNVAKSSEKCMGFDKNCLTVTNNVQKKNAVTEN